MCWVDGWEGGRKKVADEGSGRICEPGSEGSRKHVDVESLLHTLVCWKRVKNLPGKLIHSELSTRAVGGAPLPDLPSSAGS